MASEANAKWHDACNPPQCRAAPPQRRGARPERGALEDPATGHEFGAAEGLGRPQPGCTAAPEAQHGRWSVGGERVRLRALTGYSKAESRGRRHPPHPPEPPPPPTYTTTPTLTTRQDRWRLLQPWTAFY